MMVYERFMVGFSLIQDRLITKNILLIYYNLYICMLYCFFRDIKHVLLRVIHGYNPQGQILDWVNFRQDAATLYLSSLALCEVWDR